MKTTNFDFNITNRLTDLLNTDINICKSIKLYTCDNAMYKIFISIDKDIFYSPAKSKKYYDIALDFELVHTNISIMFLPHLHNSNNWLDIDENDTFLCDITPAGNKLYKFKTVTPEEREALRVPVYSYLL